RRRVAALLGPGPRVAAHRVVAAVIAAPAQFLEQPDQGQLLARSPGLVVCQKLVELVRPATQLRSRLDFTFVLKASLSRSQDLAHRIARHPEIPRDLLDRLALDQALTPGGQFWTPIQRLRGSNFHAE